MLKKFLLGTFVVALMFVGAVALTTKTASAAPQAIVTVADIQYAATVKLGSSGQASLIWQNFLNGYSTTANLVADGKFGPLSSVQAKAWQVSRGLVGDGVLGAMSRASAIAQITSGTPASAFPAGCTSTVGYSSVTGLACATVSTLPAGCTSTAGYSSTTGAKCSSSVSLPAGCSTSAGFSTTTGASCSGGSVSTNTGPLTGGAGSADLTYYATSQKDTIKEGASDVKVLGFRVEAQDSDIALQNVKVSIVNTAPTTSSYRIDRYLDSVDIFMGSTKVGSANVADFTKDSSDIYSKSIALSNAVVRNGDKDPFYVVFNAASTIDSQNYTASLTVAVDSYRYQDATGVIMTNDAPSNVTNDAPSNVTNDAPSNVTNDVTIDHSSDALTLSSSSNNPTDSTVKVDESNTTDEVLALAFKLKAGTNSSDITLDSIPVTINIEGAGASITSSTKVIDSVVVKIGSKTITADEPATTTINDGGTANVIYKADFSNEGVVIAAGETIEVKVYITFTEQGGTITPNYYENGLTIVTASVAADKITAESVNNDTITTTSGKTGAVLTLSTSAVILSNVSWTTASGQSGANIDLFFTIQAGDTDLLSFTVADVVQDTNVSNETGTLTQVNGSATENPAGTFALSSGDSANFRVRYAVSSGSEVKVKTIAGQTVPDSKQLSPTVYTQ
jgi:hypothetical protein